MKPSIYNIKFALKDKEILFNTSSQKFIVLNSEIKQCLKETDSNNTIVRQLKNNNFLVDDYANEIQNTILKKTKRIENLEVYKLVLNTSLDCNLKCWYCYETHIPKSLMTIEVAQNIILHLIDKQKTEPFKMLHLYFFGGEPMMNYKTISYLLKNITILKEKYNFDLRLIITTNGTFISDKYIELLSQYQVSFQITIDGNKETHDSSRISKQKNKGSYDKIISGLKKLNSTDANFKFVIRINYNQEILNNIKALINDLDFINRKKTIVSLQKIWQINSETIQKDSLFIAFELFNKYGFIINDNKFIDENCYADYFNEAIINYNGEVFKCTARDYTHENSYGFLISNGKIQWDYPKLKHRYERKISTNCVNCKLFPCCNEICSQKIIENKQDSCCIKDSEIKERILFHIKQQIIKIKNEK